MIWKWVSSQSICSDGRITRRHFEMCFALRRRLGIDWLSHRCKKGHSDWPDNVCSVWGQHLQFPESFTASVSPRWSPGSRPIAEASPIYCFERLLYLHAFLAPAAKSASYMSFDTLAGFSLPHTILHDNLPPHPTSIHR